MNSLQSARRARDLNFPMSILGRSRRGSEEEAHDRNQSRLGRSRLGAVRLRFPVLLRFLWKRPPGHCHKAGVFFFLCFSRAQKLSKAKMHCRWRFIWKSNFLGTRFAGPRMIGTKPCPGARKSTSSVSKGMLVIKISRRHIWSAGVSILF